MTSREATHIIKDTGPERLRGLAFRKEFDIEENLLSLIDTGNMAAYNAVMIDYPARIHTEWGINEGYGVGFCYGKIGNCGYVVRNDDLELIDDSR